MLNNGKGVPHISHLKMPATESAMNGVKLNYALTLVGLAAVVEPQLLSNAPARSMAAEPLPVVGPQTHRHGYVIG